MKKKLIVLTLLALLLAGLAAFALYGEEIIDFLFPVRNNWDEKDGIIYFNDEDGDPKTGWFLHEGRSYYLDPAKDGAMHTGWLELDGARYYLNEQGHLLAGWQEIDGKTYYLHENGAAASGWITLSDGTYYLNASGNPVSGWIKGNDCEYYLAESGKVTTGWLELNGSRYYFGEDGVRITGIVEIEGIRHYLRPDGSADAGWVETEDATFYVLEDGTIATGRLVLEDGIWYMDDSGAPLTGWQEMDGKRIYLDETGKMVTGWLKLEDAAYYMKDDGTAAVGRVVIEDIPYYFTSTGAQVILVNRWNPVPEDYQVDLVEFNGWKVDAGCYDALTKMLSDCPHSYTITSAYRSRDAQQAVWDNRIARHKAEGYSSSGALAQTAAYVARPGTSEHQLGLAVDISGASAQKWLEEHCWEYGFILRYPDGKSDITGIAYEKWHFRYVGTELAMELKDSGLCLEEYLDALTTDGTTASNPDKA